MSRIAWIDFAKGVAIILVVWGYSVIPEIDANKFMAAFRMLFFFVTAGFLLNLNKWGNAQNFKPFTEKLFWRLLVPYYLANILFFALWFVVSVRLGYSSYLRLWDGIAPFDAFTAIFIGNDNAGGLLLAPLWFLPSLFCAEMIFVKLNNRLNQFGAKVFAS